MTEVAIARINTFGPSPKADFESPSDQLIVLTYAQLQDLIKGAIEQAIQPLQDEIAQLREEIDQDRQEIVALRLKTASLEKDRDTLSENQLIQLRLIHELKERDQEKAATTKKTVDHIDDLHRLMIEDKTAQVSIAKAARLLGISKERMRQLKPLILKDDRFEIGWASVAGRKGAVIRIHKFL
jgi:regulator of replication initiation timing